MYNDDDLFVVIIGDEDIDVSKHEPIQIKEEILDEEDMKETIENLLKNAEEHGEILQFNETDNSLESFHQLDVNIKREGNEPYEFEYDVEDEYMSKDDEYMSKDDEYIPMDDEYVPMDDEFLPSDEILSDGDSPTTAKKKRSRAKLKTKASKDIKKNQFPRRKMLPRNAWKSYVSELRSQFSELKENKELLIDCLVEVMRSTKPPALPTDYYVMNGIMFECNICGTETQSIPAAGRHYQEKHGERYLICFACGVDFRSKTNLYKHEKRCSASDAVVVLKARALFLGRKGRSRPFLPNLPKPLPKKYAAIAKYKYECNECSAVFCSKSGLQSHLHLHKGERPYLCPHCPCSYTSPTTLFRHQQKHGSQEFICDHCKRSFKFKASLVLHMDTHAALKKFACSECEKRYAQRAALLLHVRRDHRGLPLPCACQLCPKRFPRMSVLKAHMKKQHGMLIMTRKMFFKTLPTLSDTQLNQAKVILKTDLNDTNAAVLLDPSFKDVSLNISTDAMDD